MNIQAILFKKEFHTKKQVDNWLRRYNYSRMKPLHTTVNYIRARIKEPNVSKYNALNIDVNDYNYILN